MASASFTVTFGGAGYYDIDGANNPSLSLQNVSNGETATFNVSAAGHPFYLKTSLGSGSSGAYYTGVAGNGTDSGAVVLTKSDSTPDILYYQCSNHSAMWGTVYVKEPVGGTTTTTTTPTTTTTTTTTTAAPTTTTTTTTTEAPDYPDDPPTTTPDPSITTTTTTTLTPYNFDSDADESTDTTGTGLNYLSNSIGSGSASSMVFPSTAVYTNSANRFRWGSSSISAVATHDITSATAAKAINTQDGPHSMGGRAFNHFGDLQPYIDKDSVGSYKNRYPYFFIKSSHPKHWFAESERSSKRGFHLGTRSQTEVIWNIEDIKKNSTTGLYFVNQTLGSYTRTPFHPRFNCAKQVHEYPRALYSSEGDFKIILNNAVANPLSKSSTYGPTLGLVFSRFYHYDQGLIEGPTGFINHNGMNGAGEGTAYFTYKVTASEPIARRASGGAKSALEWVTTWSPYNGAFRLDFTNGNAFNKQLYTSTIWS